MNGRDVLPRDAIPSVDDPTFGPEYGGNPEDRVLVLDGTGHDGADGPSGVARDAHPPRAYPFRVLDFHEIVNDDLGRPAEDDAGDSEDDDTPAPVEYDGDPYREYRNGEGFGLAAHRGEGGGREWSVEGLSPKTVVLGLKREGEALGFPLSAVRDSDGVARATVGSTEVVVFECDGELHAFADPGIVFELAAGTGSDGTVAGDGTQWDPATGEARDGRRLARLPARRLYAFTWADDHGRGAFYRAGRDGS